MVAAVRRDTSVGREADDVAFREAAPLVGGERLVEFEAELDGEAGGGAVGTGSPTGGLVDVEPGKMRV